MVNIDFFLLIKDEDIYTLFECVFPILKAEWETSVTAGDVSLDEVQRIYYHICAFISLFAYFFVMRS